MIRFPLSIASFFVISLNIFASGIHLRKDENNLFGISTLEVPKGQSESVSKLRDGTHLPEKGILYPRPADCEEVLKNGHNASGMYTIWPKSRLLKCETMKVYCDMKTAGGGWTVIQRRGQYGNSENYFSKSWQSYKQGFGDLQKEFWLGNNNICALTNQASYSVRFDLNHENGKSAFALYDYFWIDGEEYKYKLHLGEYSGNAGDALGPHNGKEFYTKDQPGSSKSSKQREGGWWHNVYPSTNLNALNRFGMDNSKSQDGISWNPFGGYLTSMRQTEIKIRAIPF